MCCCCSGIRHLLYDQGFTIKGVQRILKDQGSRYVIAIANGAPIGSLPVPPPEPDADLADGREEEHGADEAPTMAHTTNAGNALTEEDRDKLAGVLRELLDCKRLLERARET